MASNNLMNRYLANVERDKVKKWINEGLKCEEIKSLVNREYLKDEDLAKIWNEYRQQEIEENIEYKNNEKEEMNQIDIESFSLEEKLQIKNILLEEAKREEEKLKELRAKRIYIPEDLNYVDLDDKTENIENKPENKITIQNNDDYKEASIVYIDDEELEDYPNQPFKLYDEEQERKMVENIKLNGIIQPLTVRILNNDKYQILSGHNRRNCGRKAGLKNFPCIIKNYSDEEAIAILVDTNLVSREHISVMERAKALKLRKKCLLTEKKENEIKKNILEANKDNPSVYNQMVKLERMSKGNIQRYLRLNNLIAGFQNMADNGRINLKVGEIISFLSKDEQKILLQIVEDENIKLNENVCKKLKEASSISLLSKERIKEIIEENIKNEKSVKLTITFFEDEIKKCFPQFQNDANKIKNVIITHFSIKN